MQIGTIVKDTGDLPKLDTELLLCKALGKNRTWLFAHGDEEISEDQLNTFKEFIQRRKEGEPVAYITGVKEFYGREFVVNADVLIPRPCTEELVALTLDFLRTQKEETREADTEVIVASKLLGDLSEVKTIIDIGTGTGCIAITLALELPHFNFIATDISTEALAIAKNNATKYNVEEKIDFREGSLLEPVNNLAEPFLLVSNPPYIPSEEELMKDVQNYEPHGALRGGKNGGELVSELIAQAKAHPMCRGVVIECRKGQIPSLSP